MFSVCGGWRMGWAGIYNGGGRREGGVNVIKRVENQSNVSESILRTCYFIIIIS